MMTKRIRRLLARELRRRRRLARPWPALFIDGKRIPVRAIRWSENGTLEVTPLGYVPHITVDMRIEGWS